MITSQDWATLASPLLARFMLFSSCTSHHDSGLNPGRSSDSNPGAATPYLLYKLYSKQAAATANPYTLRQRGGLSFSALGGATSYAAVPTASSGAAMQLLQQGAVTLAPTHTLPVTGGSMRSRSDSPPRASFRLLTGPAPAPQQGKTRQLTLSLTSLR